MCSRSRMPIENTSSPVAQPGTQTRTVSSAPRPSNSFGMTSSARRSKASASRKKLVTLISRSRNSAADLLRVLPQPLDIALDRVELRDLHAPLHPAQEGLGLVAGEVVADLVAQDGVDLPPRLVERRRRPRSAGRRLDHAVEQSQAAGELDQPGAHLLRRQGEVHEAGGDGAVRHVRVLRPVAVGDLRQGQAAALLDRLDAERAVAVAAREHHAGRQLALVGGEGAEEDVDRLALAPARCSACGSAGGRCSMPRMASAGST